MEPDADPSTVQLSLSFKRQTMTVFTCPFQTAHFRLRHTSHFPSVLTQNYTLFYQPNTAFQALPWNSDIFKTAVNIGRNLWLHLWIPKAYFSLPVLSVMFRYSIFRISLSEKATFSLLVPLTGQEA